MYTRSLILACLLSISLSACVPLVFVAGATVGGAVIYDQRSLQTMKNDMDIGNEVQTMINSEPKDIRDQCNVTVNVLNGVVLLAGQVPSQTIANRFSQNTKMLKHVRRVYNRLTVGPVISLSRRADDTWLLSKVRTALLLAKDLRSTEISVTIENKVAFLMGMVSRSQATLATNAVRQVSGISKVVTLFEYVR